MARAPAKAPKEDLPYSAAGDRSPWLIAVIVSIATFMEVLDTTVANVSLRHIAGSLAASADESTYILTSYLVSNAIVVPISGWLANVIGRKRFYMSCVALFTVSSMLCATASSLQEIILWRVMQGIGGGGLAPVEQSIFADTFPGRQRAAAFSLYGLTVVMAPAIGPVLGGWLTDAYSWHWVFLINLPFGVLSLVLVGLFVVDSPATKERRRKLLAEGLRIDYVGFALVAVGFGVLQLVLDRFEREGGWGTPFVNFWGSICVVALVVLVFWEWNNKQPVVNVRLLRIPNFAISCALMFALGFILISTTQLLPQMAQELMGYDAQTAGLTLGAAGLVTIVVMPVSGIVTGRLVQPKYLICMAFIGTALSMWHATGIDQYVGFWDISLLRAYQAVWLPFLFIPINFVAFVGMPPERNNEASAIINLMRNLGGSVGISYTTTLLAYREQFHHARLAEHVTAYNGYGASVALGRVSKAITEQSAILSYLDIFYALALIGALGIPLALLLPRVKAGGAPAH